MIKEEIFKNKRNKYSKIIAFTLAEALIVLSMLGVVAALTIPSLYKRHTETLKRTKLKKAMTVYDSVVRRLKAEHNLNTEAKFDNYVNGEENCARTTVYFIKTEGEGCEFKTTDDVWWNISNMKRPVIAFSKTELDTAVASSVDYKDSFFFSASFDENGNIRVNDIAYEMSVWSLRYLDLKNLYAYINGQGISIPDYQKYLNGDVEYEECDTSLSGTERVNCYYITNHYKIVEKQMAGRTVKQQVADGYSKYIYDNNNNVIVYQVCEDLDGKDCREKETITSEHIGNIQITRLNCEGTTLSYSSDMCQSDGSLTRVTEYIDGKPHDDTVRYIKTFKLGCDINGNNCRSCSAYNGSTCEVDRVEGDITYYK